MEQAKLIFRTKQSAFLRISVFMSAIFLLMLLLNAVNWSIIFAIFLIIAGYLFIRPYLWQLIVIAIPLLTLGQVISWPLSLNWKYQASLTEVLFLVIAAIFFPELIIKNSNKLTFDKIAFLIAAYFLILVFSFRQAIDFHLFVFGLKAAAFSLMAYLLFSNLIDSFAKAKKLAVGLATAVLIISWQIFIKFYELGWSSKFFFDRSNILIALGPIATASAILALILPILLAFYFSSDKNDKLRFLFLTAFIIGGLAVFLSLGKAAIISLSLGLLYLFIKLKKIRVAMLLGLMVFILFSYLFFGSFFSGLFERLNNTFIDTNSKFRVTEYNLGWRLFKEQPLFGLGSGQQLWYFKKILEQNQGQLVNNYFLQAGLDLGIIGLAIALAITFEFFKKINKLRKKLEFSVMAGLNGELIIFYGFTASIIAAFFNGLAEVTFFALPYALIFWPIAGTFLNNKIYEPAGSDNNKL